MGGLLIMAACSTSSEPPPTTQVPGAATAEAAARTWLLALASGDYDGLSTIVSSGSLALAVGAENGLAMADILAIANDERPGEVAGYWQSVAASLTDDGFAPSVLAVQEGLELGVEGYAAVDLAVPGGLLATTVVVRDGADGWRVDWGATVGPGLVRPLRSMLDGLDTTAEADQVRQLFIAAGPGLRAGLEARPDLPSEFVSDVEDLLRLLGA